MDDRYYAIFRSNGHDGYCLDYTNSDRHDDHLVKSYDSLLHQTLSNILHERCLTSNQMKELLRVCDKTDQNSIIKLLLELEPILSGIFPEGNKFSLLWIAVLLCYQDSAELLVRSGADVNALCEMKFDYFPDEKWTILHRLLTMYPSSWNERFIGLVIEHGADLKARDSEGYTVLHFAVQRGRVEAAKMFLEKGADVNAAANDGKTPLLTAVYSSNADELIPVLMEHGADVTVRDAKGMNVLHHLTCAPVKHTNQARVLIEKGASLDDRVALNQYQSLHLAVREGKLELVKLFLDHGANVNARAENGVFPLYIAAEYKKHAVLFTLVEHGANIDLKTSKGRTAFHIACQNWDEQTVKILWFVGADMCVEDHDGNTPFSLMNTSHHSNSSFQLMLRLLTTKNACQQPSIELKDERRIKNHSEHWNYYQDCIEKINRMKSTKIIETCTFFDVLTKCPCQVATLMRNREFESKFRQFDINVFSMFAGNVHIAFEEGLYYYHHILRQKNIIDQAIYNILPHMIVRKVAFYILDCDRCEIEKIVHASRSGNDNLNSLCERYKRRSLSFIFRFIFSRKKRKLND